MGETENTVRFYRGYIVIHILKLLSSSTCVSVRFRRRRHTRPQASSASRPDRLFIVPLLRHPSLCLPLQLATVLKHHVYSRVCNKTPQNPTLARLGKEDILRIIEEWIAVYKKRGSQEEIKYVQIFEVCLGLVSVSHICINLQLQNKGSMMGCSNPHPHGQAWSLTEIPHIPSLELASLAKYSLNPDVQPSDAPRGPKGRPCMLCEYAHFEAGVAYDEGRVVVKNEDWVALVPWWATWPFEIMRKHTAIILLRNLCSALMASQSFHTSATSPPLHISPRPRNPPLLPSSLLSPSATTTSSPALSHTPWVSINDLSPQRKGPKRIQNKARMKRHYEFRRKIV